MQKQLQHAIIFMHSAHGSLGRTSIMPEQLEQLNIRQSSQHECCM